MNAPTSEIGSVLETLRAAMPVASRPYALPERSGLLVIDVVDGFCTPGSGPLAPARADPMIDRMVELTDIVARRFVGEGKPVLAFRDQHVPGRAEPPYPPHCEVGSGQELLVERLRWLETSPSAVVTAKDCINAAVGAYDGNRNLLHDWIVDNGLEAVVMVGICTDICIADAAVALLSARNHFVDDGASGERPMLGNLRDVVVYEPGCATYDLPASVARDVGLPETSVHPQAETHHVGLYVMQGRGAIIASELI